MYTSSMTLFFFAMLAGIVTIAGPCILPLLPIVLGTSTVRAHPSRPLFIVLGFTLSFSLFAILFGVFGSLFGISPDTFRILAAIVIGLFGFIMVFPTLQEKLFSSLQPILTKLTPRTNPADGGLWSGFVLGSSLGIVWSPCAGPVLGSILTLVASKQNLLQAGTLLFAYAIGASLPMLLIAYGGQAVTNRLRRLTPYTPTIQRVFGLLIILVAIALYTGLDRDVQSALIETYPWLFPNLKLNL
jgi:cytochrome c-type biogenesis protein